MGWTDFFSEGVEKAKKQLDAVSHEVVETKERAEQKIHDAKESIERKVHDVKEGIENKAHEAKEHIKEDIGHVKEKKDKAVRFIENVVSKSKKEAPPAPSPPPEKVDTLLPDNPAPATVALPSLDSVTRAIVTPIPTLFAQYDIESNHIDGFQGRGVPGTVAIRPAFDPEGKWPEKFDAPPGTPPGKEDTWNYSACHPTCLTMIAQWLMTHPRTKAGLSLNSRPDLPGPQEQCPVHWAKWLWDPSGDPKFSRYVSKTQHPPWLPRTPAGTKWEIDHGALSIRYSSQLAHPIGGEDDWLEEDEVWAEKERADAEAAKEAAKPKEKGKEKKKPQKKRILPPSVIAKEKNNYSLEVIDEPKTTPEDKSRKLKWITMRFPSPGKNPSETLKSMAGLIYRHGPLAMNIAIPGHFVLLYGVKGNLLYILDPGHEIIKRWGAPNGANAKNGYQVAPSRSSRETFAFKAIPKSQENHVIIDAVHSFPKVITSYDKVTQVPSYGERKFINHIFLVEAYSFSNCRLFPEFLTAKGPDEE